jgi:serine beta-lactamase-like protein LACTB
MRKPSLWFAFVAVPVGVVIAVVIGVWGYVLATATPIHRDASDVRSVVATPPGEEWTAAAAHGRAAVRDAAAAQNLPGVSVAVGLNGRVVWAEGFGYADLERKTGVTPATRFRMADASNAFTSAGAGLLLQEHRLKLDDVIQMYVPGFPEKPWPVTLRALMTNTAGVRDDHGDEEPLEERCEQTADGLRRFADRPLLFEPGTKYRRSSYGWILVSAAIEAAAGKPFFRFMHDRVFEPSGMTSTRPDAWQETIPDRATFYYPRFAGDTRYGPEPARDGDYSCFAGAGAFLSTPSDMVRFALAIDGGTLLQRATVDALQTPQHLASGEQTDYGLGWRVETIPLAGEPARAVGHHTRRDFIGGTASLMSFPDHGLTVAVTANISFADTRSIAVRIADAFAAARR